MKTRDLILNPYFIVGLIVLLLNDFYLKYEYGNFITGKLSDFAGLLIFPMFVATIIPKLGRSISLVTGLGFILWKLPLFTPVIDLINQFSFFTIYRTIDYSDYIALFILPLSHYLINKKEPSSILNWNKVKSCSRYALLGISFFAFCATSIPYREMPQGTIFIGKSYKIKLPKDSVINSIKKLGYNCDFHEKDSTQYRSISFYQTDNIVRSHSYTFKDSIMTRTDTIASMKYELEELKPNKTKLTIINVTLPKEGNIQDWKTLKSISKMYNSWLKENLIEKID